MTQTSHHHGFPIHVSPELWALLTMPAALLALGLIAAVVCSLIPWS